ncbi:MAG: SDR family NAD(P)-dependent oxidoreductase [Bacteroidales bacterium]|nr:SDR family NAD(P)-dependent oxidoreductase [Bacteroidales bacterium]
MTKKYALITGGSSGMGLEYARQLAAQGRNLLIVSNVQEQLDKVQPMLQSEYGVEVVARFQDLSKADSADELFEYCSSNGFEIDMLVCNAGMFFFKELLPSDEARMETMMNLHTLTPAKLCLMFGSEMKKRSAGNIIIMSSMASRIVAPGLTTYASTKAFLRIFGKSLYYEMRPYGVKVTTVCPGAIATPLYRLKESLMDFGVKIGVIRTPKWLVRRALRANNRGRKCISPAFMNIYLPPLIAALPDWAINKIWKKVKGKMKEEGV